MTNRYTSDGEFEFVGKGKVFDSVRNKEIDAELKFTAKIDDLGREKVMLSLVKSNYDTTWEMIIKDNDLK